MLRGNRPPCHCDGRSPEAISEPCEKKGEIAAPLTTFAPCNDTLGIEDIAIRCRHSVSTLKIFSISTRSTCGACGLSLLGLL